MPTADQWHLEVNEDEPLRQLEARVYAMELAAYEPAATQTAADLSELEVTEAALLDLARPLVASPQPSFEQALAVMLLGRCALLPDHLGRAGPPPPKHKKR